MYWLVSQWVNIHPHSSWKEIQLHSIARRSIILCAWNSMAKQNRNETDDNVYFLCCSMVVVGFSNIFFLCFCIFVYPKYIEIMSTVEKNLYLFCISLSLYPTSLASWLTGWLAGWMTVYALLYACFCALWLTMTIIPNSVRWLLNDFVWLYFNSTTRWVLFCSAEWSVVEWSEVLCWPNGSWFHIHFCYLLILYFFT